MEGRGRLFSAYWRRSLSSNIFFDFSIPLLAICYRSAICLLLCGVSRISAKGSSVFAAEATRWAALGFFIADDFIDKRDYFGRADSSSVSSGLDTADSISVSAALFSLRKLLTLTYKSPVGLL